MSTGLYRWNPKAAPNAVRAIPREGGKQVNDVLAAMVLGDGYLEPHGAGVRLQVNHSQRYREYVEWKHEVLKEFAPSPIHYCQARYPHWRFVTRTHPRLAALRRLFYVDGVKHVPVEIDQWLNTPRALAVYFMDDGTQDKRYGTLRFETQSFDPESIERLQRCLGDNFGIQTRVHRSGLGRGLRLYVSACEAQNVAEMIRPFLVASMLYKLPCPCNDSSERRMDGSGTCQSHNTPAPSSAGVEI